MTADRLKDYNRPRRATTSAKRCLVYVLDPSRRGRAAGEPQLRKPDWSMLRRVRFWVLVPPKRH